MADATSLPVPDASVDAALSVQVLEYVADPAAALAELHRALRPGGRLVIWDIDWSTVSWHTADQGNAGQRRAFGEIYQDMNRGQRSRRSRSHSCPASSALAAQPAVGRSLLPPTGCG